MDLTPAETTAAHEAGERAFRDCRSELVEEIACFIECWGKVDPKRGKLRKNMARDVRHRFGTRTEAKR